jgi:hypothetical protein
VRRQVGTVQRRVTFALVALACSVPAGVAAQAVTQPALTICVLDDTAVEEALEALVEASVINGRPAGLAKGIGGAQLLTLARIVKDARR